jgi:hypothetical protein
MGVRADVLGTATRTAENAHGVAQCGAAGVA